MKTEEETLNELIASVKRDIEYHHKKHTEASMQLWGLEKLKESQL